MHGVILALPFDRGSGKQWAAYNHIMTLLLFSFQDPVYPHAGNEGEKATADVQWRAGAVYGTALLQELVQHSHRDALRTWATAAPAVQAAVTDALSATPVPSTDSDAPFCGVSMPTVVVDNSILFDQSVGHFT